MQMAFRRIDSVSGLCCPLATCQSSCIVWQTPSLDSLYFFIPPWLGVHFTVIPSDTSDLIPFQPRIPHACSKSHWPEPDGLVSRNRNTFNWNNSWQHLISRARKSRVGCTQPKVQEGIMQSCLEMIDFWYDFHITAQHPDSATIILFIIIRNSSNLLWCFVSCRILLWESGLAIKTGTHPQWNHRKRIYGYSFIEDEGLECR